MQRLTAEAIEEVVENEEGNIVSEFPQDSKSAWALLAGLAASCSCTGGMLRGGRRRAGLAVLQRMLPVFYLPTIASYTCRLQLMPPPLLRRRDKKDRPLNRVSSPVPQARGVNAAVVRGRLLIRAIAGICPWQVSLRRRIPRLLACVCGARGVYHRAGSCSGWGAAAGSPPPLPAEPPQLGEGTALAVCTFMLGNSSAANEFPNIKARCADDALAHHAASGDSAAATLQPTCPCQRIQRDMLTQVLRSACGACFPPSLPIAPQRLAPASRHTSSWRVHACHHCNAGQTTVSQEISS